jgi:hypothetical protein
LSNSEEENDSEMSGLTFDFDTIEGVIEEANEVIDPEIEEGTHEVTEEVIEVVERRAIRSGRMILQQGESVTCLGQGHVMYSDVYTVVVNFRGLAP